MVGGSDPVVLGSGPNNVTWRFIRRDKGENEGSSEKSCGTETTLYSV